MPLEEVEPIEADAELAVIEHLQDGAGSVPDATVVHVAACVIQHTVILAQIAVARIVDKRPDDLITCFDGDLVW